MAIRPLVKRGRAVFRRWRDDEATSSSVDQNSIDQAGVVHQSTTEGKTDTDGEKAPPAFEQADPQPELPNGAAQHGVRDAEAIALTWPKSALIFVFCNIWFLYFVNAFQSSVYGSLSSYVSSSFQEHSLSGVPTALADAFAAATFLPVGRMMDTWGRAEGFLLMTIFATIGLILMASCDSFAIYCAAVVFYNIGFSGMEYAIDVVTADMTQLKNRGFAYAFTSSPYIITAFAGPKVADRFYYEVSWRWGFGCWAIIFPIVAAPLYIVLKYYLHKAEKEGHRLREPSGRTLVQSIKYWVLEFDLVGCFIFTAGLVLFEVPFDIAADAPDGWATGYIIAMLVVGFSMLFFFGIYERFIAPTPLFNFRLLTDRTVLGACLLDATYQLSYYCWNNFFQNFLQVVYDMSIADSGYILNTFDVVSGVLLLFVGWTIRKTGRFKWLLYIAIPLYIFAQGLMIYFRKPGMGIGYQVMCQIFISMGGAVFIICEQLAILAAVDHQHFATALALLNVVGTIGDSAGYTICTAIWTNTFRNNLIKYLPQSAMSDLDNIYNDVNEQISYAVGSPTRIGIQKAYADSEVILLSTGVGIMGLAFIWLLLIRNIDLKKVPQVKGMVF